MSRLSNRTSGSHSRAVARHAGPEFPTISHISPAIDTIESTGGVSRRAREEAAVLHGKTFVSRHQRRLPVSRTTAAKITTRGKCESADKPGSVVDSHSSRMHVAMHLKRPTRIRHGQRHRIPIWPCSERGLPSRSCCQHARCALTAPFHPYRRERRRFAFCCTFRGLAPPRRYLALCPMEPGLSSTRSKPRSGCLADSRREDITRPLARERPSTIRRSRTPPLSARRARARRGERPARAEAPRTACESIAGPRRRAWSSPAHPAR